MDILVKVSGDLIGEESFYEWLSSISDSLNRLFILCGGGTLITRALKNENIDFSFGPAGREIESEHGRHLSHVVLRSQRDFVEEELAKRGIKAAVHVPLEELKDKTCSMNADIYAIALYPGFDKIYIVTLEGREKSFSEKFDRIEVVYL